MEHSFEKNATRIRQILRKERHQESDILSKSILLI